MKTTFAQTIAAIQAVPPAGAAAIFISAYLASCIGWVAMLVVCAFLAGLHFARRSTQLALIGDWRAESRTPSAFEQMTGSGMVCTRAEFKTPRTPAA